MSDDLIAAARRLADDEQTSLRYVKETDINMEYCRYCNRDVEAWTGDPIDHAPDCPWLALPRIVRALEAARVVAANVDDGRAVSSLPALFRSVHALQAELWDPSQNAEASTSE